MLQWWSSSYSWPLLFPLADALSQAHCQIQSEFVSILSSLLWDVLHFPLHCLSQLVVWLVEDWRWNDLSTAVRSYLSVLSFREYAGAGLRCQEYFITWRRCSHYSTMYCRICSQSMNHQWIILFFTCQYGGVTVEGVSQLEGFDSQVARGLYVCSLHAPPAGFGLLALHTDCPLLLRRGWMKCSEHISLYIVFFWAIMYAFKF